MNIRVQLFVVTTLCSLMISANANENKKNDGFFEDHERGWFWREEPVIHKKETIKKEELTQSSLSPKEEPFTSKWLKKNLPVLMNKALDNPSSTNVAMYQYAQRIMMDKAHVFSNMYMNNVKRDPFLQENNRMPFGSAAKAAYSRTVSKAKGEIFKSMSGKVAIWFFFDPKCEYCIQQLLPIQNFGKSYGIDVEIIVKNGFPSDVPVAVKDIKIRIDDGVSDALGIKISPTLAMIFPPNKVVILTQGLATKKEIEDVAMVHLIDMGFVSKTKLAAIKPQDAGILENSDYREIDFDSDPAKFINELREKMGAYAPLYEKENQEYENETD